MLEYHAKRDQELEQSFQEKMMEEVNKYQPPGCCSKLPWDHGVAAALKTWILWRWMVHDHVMVGLRPKQGGHVAKSPRRIGDHS